MLKYALVELIFAIVFILSFILLGFDNVRLRIKNNDIKKTVISLATESSIIAQRLKEELEIKQNPITETNDGFLKFVSQSRDWAFQYIEEVQFGIKEFVDDVKSEIEYFDEYGNVGADYPHYHSMKKISGAYKKLKQLLPEDYNEKL